MIKIEFLEFYMLIVFVIFTTIGMIWFIFWAFNEIFDFISDFVFKCRFIKKKRSEDYDL